MRVCRFGIVDEIDAVSRADVFDSMMRKFVGTEGVYDAIKGESLGARREYGRHGVHGVVASAQHREFEGEAKRFALEGKIEVCSIEIGEIRSFRR